MALDSNAEWHIAICAVPNKLDMAVSGAARAPTEATKNGALTDSWTAVIAANELSKPANTTLVAVVSNHSSDWMYVAQDDANDLYQDIAPGQSRDFDLDPSKALKVRK